MSLSNELLFVHTAPELYWDQVYLPQEYEACVQQENMYINDLLSQYWLCDTQGGLSDLYTQSCLSKRNSMTEMRPTKGKIFDYNTIQIRWANLYASIEDITDNQTYVVRATKKVQRRNLSSRRSAYIGVSRNGPNWQSMISINKRKSYIGTYPTEMEAAVAFDLYSLLIHGLSAKTNFSYTKPQLVELLSNYIF